MAYVRLTILKPAPEHRDEALSKLKELDHVHAGHEGLIMSLVFQEEQSLGRLAVWESEAQANAAAHTENSLAIRSQLQAMPGEHTIEMLARAETGTWSSGAPTLLAQILRSLNT